MSALLAVEVSEICHVTLQNRIFKRHIFVYKIIKTKLQILLRHHKKVTTQHSCDRAKVKLRDLRSGF